METTWAGAIILAAGESRRMGRQKALIPLSEDGSITWIGEVQSAARANQLSPLLAVLSPLLADIQDITQNLDIVQVNTMPENGQLYSLQLALKIMEQQPVEGAIIYVIDSPGKMSERTNILMNAVYNDRQTVRAAGHANTPGHPIWIPRNTWSGIIKYEGPDGLRGFLASQNITVAVAECGAESLRDWDTVEERGEAG